MPETDNNLQQDDTQSTSSTDETSVSESQDYTDQLSSIDTSLKEIIEVIDPDVTETTSVLETDNGVINVVHDISLGDILVFTLLLMLLIFQIIKAIVRR